MVAYPALFLGLHFLLAAALTLYPHPIYLPILLLLWRKASFQKIGMGLSLFVAGAVYTLQRQPPSFVENRPIEGLLSIDKIESHCSPFHKGIRIRAQLSRVPCLLFFEEGQERPSADVMYLVQGRLTAKDHGPPVLRVTGDFRAVSKRFNLEEWRFAAKQKLRAFLSSHVPHRRALHFLHALLTGEIQDRELILEFRKVGLSHLLAISGFHFVLILGIVGLFVRRCRFGPVLLLLLATFYFFFLGASASTLRAFTATLLFLFGKIFHLQTRPLNLLGVALLVELLYDPLSLTEPGFQLTFLSTLGLLLFFGRVERGLTYLFPLRPLSVIQNMSFLDRHFALFSGLIRKGLAATFSAHLLSLGVCLAHFHSFPLLSILYNLFFPLGVALSLFLCILALFLGPFGAPLHFLNSLYTDFLLRLVAASPRVLDVAIHVRSLPFGLVVGGLALLTFLGIDQKRALPA